jgi:phage gpG-like protein
VEVLGNKSALVVVLCKYNTLFNMLDKIPNFQQIGKQLILDAQTIAEVEMINFVLSNFERQGFLDNSITPWAERKDNSDSDRALLVKNNTLIDSFSISESSIKMVKLSSSAAHAKIHNEGGILNIPITKKSRLFFWAKYKETGNSMYKGMALTKKIHFTVTIPKRQFMGESIYFNNLIDTKFIKMIERRFKTQ